MRASDTAFTMIKKYEGLRLNSYRCAASVPTIGWGHTQTARIGQSITVRQAEQLLVSDVYLIEMMLNAVFRNSLNQNQFDALVSFIFNVGTTRFRHSSLFALIKCNPADPAISAEFAKWVYGGDGQNNGRDDDGDGMVDEPGEKLRLPGLIARRADESNLYFT